MCQTRKEDGGFYIRKQEAEACLGHFINLIKANSSHIKKKNKKTKKLINQFYNTI